MSFAAVDVLVVEDDEPVARLLRALLERDGLRVHLAADAAQALEFLGSGGCRVVLTDFTMPGMNGLELIRTAEALGSRTPFLVMSAWLEPGLLRELVDEPAVAGVVGKPFEVDALLRDVRAAAGLPPPRAAGGKTTPGRAGTEAASC